MPRSSRAVASVFSSSVRFKPRDGVGEPESEVVGLDRIETVIKMPGTCLQLVRCAPVPGEFPNTSAGFFFPFGGPMSANEDAMPNFARLWGREPRHRCRAPMRLALESLEGRMVLSATAASAAATTPPADVATITTLKTQITTAETGQIIPLTATVKNASTSAAVTDGSVEFLTVSANPLILGTAKLDSNGEAELSTKLLKDVGSYQVEAAYSTTDNAFASSTSAPIPVSITPTTVNSPTQTTLQLQSGVIQSGQPVQFQVTVNNSSSDLANGIVEFTTVGKHPQVLGVMRLGQFNNQLDFETFALKKVGNYRVEAVYLSETNQFAVSTSPPIVLSVIPAAATAFRVTPLVKHSRLNKPTSFVVTALNSDHQPIPDYTGTVVFSSPTDSWTIFPPSTYVNLNTFAPSLQSPGLATFAPPVLYVHASRPWHAHVL